MGVYLRVENETHNLPSEYQEVEYIQNSGTQYIDTLYTPLTTTEFEIEYEPVSYNQTYMCPFGCRRDYQTNCYYIGYTSSRSYYGFGSNHIDPSSVNLGGTGTRRKITYHNNTLSNGTQTASVSVNTAPYGTMAIFGDNDGGAVGEIPSMKLYSFKLWEGSTLVREYVPCYRKLDDVIGVYDTVNDVFYTNNGTGTFTKGADTSSSIQKELKNGYIGGYVEPRTPGANTIAYFPFETDILDHSGNSVTLSTSGFTYTQQPVGYLFSGNGGVELNDSSVKFINVWMNIQTKDTPYVNGAYMSGGGLCYSAWHSLSKLNGVFTRYIDASYNTDVSNKTNLSSGWHNFAIGYDSTTTKCYLDGGLFWTSPGLPYSFGSGAGLFSCWGNSSNSSAILSQGIFEDKAWTAQEVTDYYNQTKSNYGL